MAYQVLALKYRPKLFSEVRGQEQITATLSKSLAERRIANAYLFTGPRGVGKTTTARILARSLNCLKGPVPDPCNECESCREILESRSLDFLEIDGASNRGIDEIRTINENTQFLPVKNRYKIYLIDEVHMLTDYAFNALLKTLEEPPKHTRFIFATTNPDKLLPTIISRCQRYDFHLISGKEIARHLTAIAEREKISIEPAALIRISQSSAGSLRDALSILDQIASFRYGELITASDVENLLSLVSEETYLQVIQAFRTGDRQDALKIIAQVSSAGYDLFQFCSGILEFVRYLLLIKSGAKELILDSVTPETMPDLEQLAGRFTQEELLKLLEIVADERDKLKYEDLVRVRLEASFLKVIGIFGKPERNVQKKEVRTEAVSRPASAADAQVADREKRPVSTSEIPAGEEVPVVQLWPEFVSALGREKPFFRPLLQAGQLERVETGRNGTILHIRFRRQFEKDLLERNYGELTEFWKRKFGAGVHFEGRLETAKPIEETKVHARPSDAPQKEILGTVQKHAEPTAAEMKPHHSASLTPEEEDIVRRVLKIFDGEVVSIGREV